MAPTARWKWLGIGLVAGAAAIALSGFAAGEVAPAGVGPIPDVDGHLGVDVEQVAASWAMLNGDEAILGEGPGVRVGRACPSWLLAVGPGDPVPWLRVRHLVPIDADPAEISSTVLVAAHLAGFDTAAAGRLLDDLLAVTSEVEDRGDRRVIIGVADGEAGTATLLLQAPVAGGMLDELTVIACESDPPETPLVIDVTVTPG